MRIRLTWTAAILVLIAIGLLVACSTKYTKSSNGLVVVATEASAVMQTFSLNLGNGQLSQINNVKGPPTNGVPGSVVLDPAGDFAYVIVFQNPGLPGSMTGIETFQVSSDGKLSAVGTTPLTNPVALAIDSAGKFLFVANGSQGTVSVFSISSGTLSEVANSPFPVPPGSSNATASALAVTPTIYPVQFAFCSNGTPPTTENLYVADSVNNVLFNYSVAASTGALSLTPFSNAAPGISTGTTPAGVAVDPCNRFVYVSNSGSNSNSVSAYTICSAITPSCSRVDFSLTPVAGSPFAVSPGDGPGPLAVDPFGNFLYVVDSGSSQLSAFRIGSSSGSLTSIGTFATGTGANSIAIRSDDTWIFVTSLTTSTLSEYAIVPASGTLAPQAPVTTFNTPTGVAVK
jgi:6-phosphogluconolactonase (cycloisomerase 2 family)